jgi:cytochrome c biogenesis protein CcmG, thiol:disulfide interchange protein DsbE
MGMNDLYTTLGVPPEADQQQIDRAYQNQRDRYALERVKDLDPELVQVAEARMAELERAYRILSDPERRQQYDASLKPPTPRAAVQHPRGLTARERMYAVIGAGLALILVATVWMLTGRDAVGLQGQAMGAVNRPAPSFSLPELGGGTIDLEQYRGQVVLLNFWATWCEPCQRELPALQAAHERYGNEGLMIIGVNLADDELRQGTTPEQIREFLDQYSVTFPIALDVDGKTTDAYRVFPLPTSFFIDPTGQIRYVHVSELRYDDISARFNELRDVAAATSDR